MNEIRITQLNDFVFCPISLYFHNLYGDQESITYGSEAQINGKLAHEAIDTGTYSTRKDILMGLDVYCEKYGLIGKIDIYDRSKKCLIERKRKINQIYDGYIFQLYAQYFSMKEMKYEVEKLYFHSLVDNKRYLVDLPEQNMEMFRKFEQVICDMRNFKMDDFKQDNPMKCKNCVYFPACDRGIEEC